ncbi:hypothetical protein BU17DRAFT_39904, partial [Hysterangium stoloniferum]
FTISFVFLFSFANQSARFINAYIKGLNHAQAVWANGKYHGHQTLPDNILRMFEEGQS